MFIGMEPRVKRHKIASNDFNGVHGVTDLSVNPCEHHPYKIEDLPVTSSTTINDLHPELLSIIFLYLDTKSKAIAAQVCSSWRDAVYHKSVWKGVEAKISLKSSKENAPLLKSLVCRGIKRIQVLSFERGIVEVTTKIKNLESLTLTGCWNLTDEHLMAALSFTMPSLTELGLGMCKGISDDGFFEISENLHNLEKLDLGGCHKITDITLETIRDNLRKLKKLNLRSCKYITDAGISRLCSSRFNQETLVNASDPSNHHQPNCSHRSRTYGSERCSRHSYNGCGCDNTSEYSDCITTLELLDLHDCQTLTDDSLRYISSGLKNLKILNLSFCVGITDMGLKYLSSLSQLKEINLRSCNSISDIGLRYLSESEMQLENLDISFCEKIGDIGMDHISQGLQSLQDLSLNSCSITDRGLIKLSQNLTKLKTLKIGQCNKITDEGIFAVADNCRKLESIDLYGCTRLTAAGYQKILDLPELKYANTDLWQDQQSANEYFKAIHLNSSKLLANARSSYNTGERLKSTHNSLCFYSNFAFNYYKNLFSCNDNVIINNCIVTTKLCDSCRSGNIFNYHLDGAPYYVLLKIENRT